MRERERESARQTSRASNIVKQMEMDKREINIYPSLLSFIDDGNGIMHGSNASIAMKVGAACDSTIKRPFQIGSTMIFFPLFFYRALFFALRRIRRSEISPLLKTSARRNQV